MWQVSTGQTKGLSQGQLNKLSICPHSHDKSLAHPGKAGGEVHIVDKRSLAKGSLWTVHWIVLLQGCKVSQKVVSVQVLGGGDTQWNWVNLETWMQVPTHLLPLLETARKPRARKSSGLYAKYCKYIHVQQMSWRRKETQALRVLSPKGGSQGNFLDWCALEICSWGTPLKVCPMNWSLSTNWW